MSATEISDRVKEGMEIGSFVGALKLVGHFLAFFILGGMIAAAHEPPINRCGFVFFAILAAVFCAGLEFAQLFLESRHGRFSDLLGNFSGFLLGTKTLISWKPARYVRRIVEETLRLYAIRLQIGICIVAITIWYFAALQPILGSLTMDWNEDYRLTIANESDGTRPWLGDIRYVRIYGKALTPRQVLFAYRNREARSTPDASSNVLLAGYDFTDRPTNQLIPKGLLRSERLAIQIPALSESAKDNQWIPLTDDTLLISKTALSELTAAIEASGALSVEVWIRPLNQDQKGPARIITLSNGIWRRNFTLGQEASDMIFRVRNEINGPNGSEFALRVKEVVENRWHHWVAVYDHGVSSLFRDGLLLRPTIDLREPSIYLLLGSRMAGHAVAGAFLAITLAVPVYSMFSPVVSGSMRHLAAVLLAFCVGSLPYIYVCLLVGGPWRPDFLLSFASALILFYPVGFLYVRRPAFEKHARTASQLTPCHV